MLACSQRAVAQGLPGSELPETPAAAPSAGGESDVEALYDKDEVKPPPKAVPKVSDKAPAPDAKNLSDLAKLAPFSDIAVIQRRFLPKTGRFEATAIGFTNLNNPFFTSYGVGARMAYYIRERYAVEGIVDVTSTGSREVTDNLSKNRNVTTSSVVTSKAFYGGAFKWNPIYGKITWLNKSIVPFDLNFNLGLGMTATTSNQSVATVHFGTSQVFAYTKSMAFRWDLTWNMYQANGQDGNGANVKLTQNDLFLGIGMSFYFPEASYR